MAEYAESMEQAFPWAHLTDLVQRPAPQVHRPSHTPLLPQIPTAKIGDKHQGAIGMSYTPISIDREALTIMDVPFPTLEAWESAAAAIGSNMFEGYEPTKHGIEIIRDYTTGKISFDTFIRAARDKAYAK